MDENRDESPDLEPDEDTVKDHPETTEDTNAAESATDTFTGEPPADDVDGNDADGDDKSFAANDLGDFNSQARNRQVLGQLVVHFRDRDVISYVDGDSAMRVMACYARRTRIWADPLHPEVSDACSMWLAIDPEQVLAMTWIPGVPKPTARLTIDPPVPAA